MAQALAVFYFCPLLHLFDDTTIIDNFPAQQGLDRILQCHYAGGLAICFVCGTADRFRDYVFTKSTPDSINPDTSSEAAYKFSILHKDVEPGYFIGMQNFGEISVSQFVRFADKIVGTILHERSEPVG